MEIGKKLDAIRGNKIKENRGFISWAVKCFLFYDMVIKIL